MSFENWNRFVQDQLSGKQQITMKKQQNNNLNTTQYKQSNKDIIVLIDLSEHAADRENNIDD